ARKQNQPKRIRVTELGELRHNTYKGLLSYEKPFKKHACRADNPDVEKYQNGYMTSRAVPGGAQGQVGWGPGQPELVGGSPAHGRGEQLGGL
ncbi:hypothetical protein, partial [Escherichia coli]|uniref:hypothetical protein n=1 Tax=Escherichia coli TaxID=562 RepID=UPI0032DA3744